MLTLVHLENFGAVGPAGLDLATSRITVLVGENGTGKSSVLRALGVLAQTADSQNRTGLVHDGNRIRFERFEDFSFGLDPKARVGIGVDVTLTAEQMRLYADQRDAIALPPSVEISYRCVSWRDRGWAHAEQSVTVGGASAVVGRPHGNRGTTPVIIVDGKDEGPALGPSDRIFDAVSFTSQEGNRARIFPNSVAAVGGFLAQRVHAIATARSAAGFSMEAATRPARDTGPSGAFTLHFIHEQTTVFPARGRVLEGWLARLGLPGFRVGYVAGRYAPMFDDGVSRATLPLYLAGQGHQQIVELLAELAFAPKDAVITVEEPENGLHPSAQATLADIVVEAVEAHELQVVLSTQSPTLALAFCRAVRAGRLGAESLALHQLSRDASGTRSERLSIDDQGLTHPAWFSSFARAEADLLREFLPSSENYVADAKPRKSRPARR